MPVTLPIEVYEIFEKGFGKEDAKKVLKSLEAVIGDNVIDKWHQTKEELKTELLKEVATKGDLENVRLELLGIMKQDKAELLGIMKQDKAELLGKIDTLYEKAEKDKIDLEGKIERLNQKFNFMIVLMIIALTLMNPVVAEIIKGLIRP